MTEEGWANVALGYQPPHTSGTIGVTDTLSSLELSALPLQLPNIFVEFQNTSSAILVLHLQWKGLNRA